MSFGLSKQSLEYMHGLVAQHRAALIEAKDGSRQRWLFNDKERRYEVLSLAPLKRPTRRVSNVESFAAMTLEEARRGAVAGLGFGEFMTAQFFAAGAILHLDDRACLDVFEYRRELSPQWKTLVGAEGREMDHKSFIRLLQTMRPSFLDYAKVLMAYRRISIDASAAVQSAPMLEPDGTQGYAYAFKVKVGGKDVDARLPSVLELELQFARGSAKTYRIDAEVNIDLKSSGDKSVPVFSIALPERSVVEEQAIADELASFKDAVKSLTLLHILESY